jgi:HK97 family phage major capsid protein
MQHIILPRALRSGPPVVRAENRDPAALFAEINRAVSALRSNVESELTQDRQQLANLESALNAMQQQIGGGTAPGGLASPEPDYSRAFAAYSRNGDCVDTLRSANSIGDRATVHAAMSVGSNTDGGYLAPVEWDRQLHQRQRATSPMRRLATVQATSVGAFTSLWNGDTWGSGWVGETAARPTTSSATLAPIPFAAGEIYANVAATQRLLDDAAVNVDSWLIDSLEREFTRQEAIAFLSGDGVNKPNGLLTYATGGSNAATHPGGAITVVESAITPEGITDFMFGLAAPYRQNATWLMSSLTAAYLAKWKGIDGEFLWEPSLQAERPSLLLGRPVEIDEGMPAPMAGNLAIAFGDFKRGYLINDRIGTRVLRDPYTNKPFVMFYATKRVGAGLLDPNAIRVLRLPVT